MSNLKNKIEEDFKTAMKARDESYQALSFLRAAIKQVEVDTRKELTDDDIISILKREVKKRKESISEYEKGGRTDLVEKETREMQVLQKYLPEQISEEELKKLIDEVISETGAIDIKQMGQVIGKVMEKARGRADGATVSRLVKAKLGSGL